MTGAFFLSLLLNETIELFLDIENARNKLLIGSVQSWRSGRGRFSCGLLLFLRLALLHVAFNQSGRDASHVHPVGNAFQLERLVKFFGNSDS